MQRIVLVKITPENMALVLRYTITGLVVAATYICVHFLLTLYLDVDSLFASPIAFLIAILFQYILHSRFTFKGKTQNSKQIGKFLVTIFVGLLVSHLVVNVFGPRWGISQLFSLVFVVVILPVTNFILFSVWVFVPYKSNKCSDA